MHSFQRTYNNQQHNKKFIDSPKFNPVDADNVPSPTQQTGPFETSVQVTNGLDSTCHSSH